MKGIHEVSQKKEAELAQVRKEIQSLQLVAPLLSEEPLRSTYEVLQQKEADLAQVRKEIECLQLVAPLLSEEPSDELTRKPASSERPSPSHGLEATGTDNLFSSVTAPPRPRFWKILKRKD